MSKHDPSTHNTERELTFTDSSDNQVDILCYIDFTYYPPERGIAPSLNEPGEPSYDACVEIFAVKPLVDLVDKHKNVISKGVNIITKLEDFGFTVRDLEDLQGLLCEGLEEGGDWEEH